MLAQASAEHSQEQRLELQPLRLLQPPQAYALPQTPVELSEQQRLGQRPLRLLPLPYEHALALASAEQSRLQCLEQCCPCPPRPSRELALARARLWCLQRAALRSAAMPADAHGSRQLQNCAATYTFALACRTREFCRRHSALSPRKACCSILLRERHASSDHNRVGTVHLSLCIELWDRKS